VGGIREGPDAFFRLSPGERLKALCFGVRRGEASGRIDTNYWRLKPFVELRLSKPNFPVVKLGKHLSFVQYGSSALAKAEPPGVAMLRMNNLQDDGWDLSDLKYIQLSDKEVENLRLIPGDILFNRTNSKELVGKCAVFRESGDWVFASYLIRFGQSLKN
jgi:type I restriction enzyme S subunit